MGRFLGIRWDCGNRTGIPEFLQAPRRRPPGGGIIRDPEAAITVECGAVLVGKVAGDQLGQQVKQREQPRIQGASARRLVPVGMGWRAGVRCRFGAARGIQGRGPPTWPRGPGHNIFKNGRSYERLGAIDGPWGRGGWSETSGLRRLRLSPSRLAGFEAGSSGESPTFSGAACR